MDAEEDAIVSFMRTLTDGLMPDEWALKARLTR